MRAKYRVALAFALALPAVPVLGQSTEESALKNHVSALQSAPEGSAEAQRLMEAAIRSAARLRTRPAISPEARRFFVRGGTAIKEATSSADFEDAAKEFAKATRLAPWWADAHFNQAVAYEKAGNLRQAIASFKLYLLAAPNNKDAPSVSDQIAALEYRLEKAEKNAADKSRAEESERQRKTAFINDLSGVWQDERMRYAVSANGDAISILSTAWWYPPDRRWVPVQGEPPRYGPGIAVRFEGRVQGLSISGTVVTDFRSNWRNGQVFTRPMSGTIDAEGKRIQLQYSAVNPGGGRGGTVTNWVERPASVTLERQ